MRSHPAVRAFRWLLATFQTSRYDEWGERREDLGLADVAGVSAAGEFVGPHSNGYIRMEQRNEVTAGFEGTDILPGPEYRLAVRQGNGRRLS